ncbi:hypothetical protein Tsubulata_010353 [Turnera subulata]|uniref:Uncharacterized protein n=1 Tax=Turnera subulata TaxID=218843 RepID=A0A9Q0F7Z1_9ROSI|nr:hypothetical protein Tsubulata_010353 [Turnera subulata]
MPNHRHQLCLLRRVVNATSFLQAIYCLFFLYMFLYQMAPHPAMQQGAYYMQHPQAAAAAAMAQQSGIFPPKMPLQFNNPHQIQDPQQLHQQAMQGQMAMRAMGPNNGMHPMHAETTLGGNAPSAGAGSNDVRGGNKQDASEAGTTGPDGQGTSAAGHGGGDGSEDGK